MLLQSGEIKLRTLRRADKKQWEQLRFKNEKWLRPWEATSPDPLISLPSFQQMLRFQRREEKALRSITWAVVYQGRICGQITLAGISFGSYRGGHIGYWITQELAGRGFIPMAVNLVSEYAFKELGLHRLEISMRPENAASKQVALKCGFEFESLRKRFLHIDGDWRDHHTYVKVHESTRSGHTP